MNTRKFIAVVVTAFALTSGSWAQQRWAFQRPPDRQHDRRDNRRDDNRPQPRIEWPARNQAPPQQQPQGPNNDRRSLTGKWLKEHKDQPPQEQKRALENDPNFRNLSPQGQQRLKERLNELNSLPPQQRDSIVRRMQVWERLTPDQRQRGHQLFQQFRALPPERRQALSQAFHNLSGMDATQRDRLIDSPDYRSRFSDNEREMLRGLSDLNIGPARQ